VLAAPVKTPAPIVATLSDKVRTALKTPDGLRRWQQERGLEVIASTPEEMTAHLKKEIAKWRVVFKEQGIKAE
jgi:tripartite-type tricarboxylate transporter receptor subunit TctC